MLDHQATLFVMRDMMDSQLETRDGIRVGRVADVRAEWRDDDTLVLTHLLTGPQALAGRLSEHLRPFARFLLRDRFEHAIPLSEVECFGPTIRLRGCADDYTLARADRWIASHILRWIPGSGL